jgi:transcriptional regulator of arginine metabolism
MRSERRRDLMRILHEGSATSQGDIVNALREMGHEVTQATVSRDLGQLGAARVRLSGRTIYRLPDDLATASAKGMSEALARSLDEFALEITPAGNLVVVKTAPGYAGAVGRAIDLAGPEHVVGCVAGDDTIFVATASEQTAKELVSDWRADSPEGRGVS